MIKKMAPYANHITLSLILFCACLVFPGFYTGTAREPYFGVSLLLSGWLGVLMLHFAWFANPVYFIALKMAKSEPQFSVLLSVLALVLALSFLLWDNVAFMMFEKPTAEQFYETKIKAYGWGYFLWVLSIAIFALGQARKNRANQFPEKSRRFFDVMAILWIVVMTCVFVSHRYIGADTQYEIEARRDRQFREYCQSAKEVFHKKMRNVHGLYFDAYVFSDYEPGFFGLKAKSVLEGRGGQALVDQAYIAFIEVENKRYVDAINTENKSANKPFLRFRSDDQKKEEVDIILSEYLVVTGDAIKQKDPMMKIEGTRMLIIDHSNNEVVASTAFFTNTVEKTYCFPDPKTGFSSMAFILHALQGSGIAPKIRAARD